MTKRDYLILRDLPFTEEEVTCADCGTFLMELEDTLCPTCVDERDTEDTE